MLPILNSIFFGPQPGLVPSIVSNTHPYLDPGSGSLIIQVIAATALGALVLVRVYWRKIKGIFRHSSPQDSEDTDGDES